MCLKTSQSPHCVLNPETQECGLFPGMMPDTPSPCPVMIGVVLVAGGETHVQLAGVMVYSWFISGCLVKERPVPGQKHQGENMIEM